MNQQRNELGLKFSDRTFRFVRLSSFETGPQLTAAGAGLIPFDAKQGGQMRPEGADRLIDALARSLDRADADRGGVVVVLDGRAVLQAVFPVSEELAASPEGLEERARWELDRRRADIGEEEGLHVEVRLRRGPSGQPVADAWGAYPGTLRAYDQVVQGAGCHVSGWSCDARALYRLFEAGIPEEERDDLTALTHVEADAMEVILADRHGWVGLTALRAGETGAFRRAWDPDDPEEVAREVAWWVTQLGDRWLPGSRQEKEEVARVLFTGSVDEPDRLLGALTRALPMRVEPLDLDRFLDLDPSVASSPLIQGNLGAFALSIGGALAHLSP
ncbi:MAG: hypothetical protein R6W82_05040 [bacterium]